MKPRINHYIHRIVSVMWFFVIVSVAGCGSREHVHKSLDLAVSEINYVCLYAIGLRGKDVGAYMKKRSHVNISSAIRAKLGIDRHETNIGIYVRKLLKNL